MDILLHPMFQNGRPETLLIQNFTISILKKKVLQVTLNYFTIYFFQ